MDDLALAPRAMAAWADSAGAALAVVEAAPDLWEVSDADLMELLRTDRVAAARREAARLAVIRELDARGVAASGAAVSTAVVSTAVVSTAAWLAAELLVEPRVAAADVRAARALDPLGDVPPVPGVLGPARAPGEVVLAATGRDLVAGTITREHADAVAGAVRALPIPADPLDRDKLLERAETFLREQSLVLCPADVRRLGRAVHHVVDPDGVLMDERTAERVASFWVRADPHSASVRFGGTTDAVTGAQLATLVDAHAAPRPDVDPVTGVSGPDLRTADQRRGEAFAHLVRLAAGADDSHSGGVATTLVVTCSVDTLRAELGERGIRCGRTETGHPLSAALVRRLACDAKVIPVLLGSASEPLDVGRATRTIPPAIRRALVVRDNGCAFPGCTRPARWADAHHIRHWADGGDTALDNLVLLCGHHHDTIHHTGWTVRITDGRPAFGPPARARGADRGPRPRAPASG